LFVFVPDETIVYATVNFPGSWHDGHFAEELYTISTNIPTPFCLAADSEAEFNHKDMANKMTRHLKSDELEKETALGISVRKVADQATSSRTQYPVFGKAWSGAWALCSLCAAACSGDCQPVCT
jgi:hypothetical protein